MKKKSKIFSALFLLFNYSIFFPQTKIINHNCTKIHDIPRDAIINAKNSLHIAYGHTSHGSQLITGMNNLDHFFGNSGLYLWNDGPLNGCLDIDDRFASGDLGNPDRTSWASRTRDYLNSPSNIDVNVIIWSWCGQVSSASETDINTYLNLMNQLEMEYPGVTFVYMTGHLDGTGLSGNLHIRNEQIREFCINNNKFLFDFADIECYDPDGSYFGDKIPNDNCDYDSDGNGTRDGNWAVEWQNLHLEGVDWYNCSSAHSQALNANLKAYAAWWLWASVAGWEGTTSDNKDLQIIDRIELFNNYPNPFNPFTKITYSIPRTSFVNLQVFNSNGEKVATLVNQIVAKGYHEAIFHSADLSSGVYFYRLTSYGFTKTKSMMIIK